MQYVVDQATWLLQHKNHAMYACAHRNGWHFLHKGTAEINQHSSMTLTDSVATILTNLDPIAIYYFARHSIYIYIYYRNAAACTTFCNL